MVSHIGLINRTYAAQTRIDAALAAIAEHGAVAIAPVPEKTRDVKQNETLRLEWLADTLEAMTPKPTPKDKRR